MAPAAVPVTNAVNYTRIADNVLANVDKSSSELLALMYGSLVTQVLKDVEDIPTANAELERLGYETGLRLIEDFMARTQLSACPDFRTTCEVIAKVGLKIYLGMAGEVISEENEGATCTVSLPTNPLAEFVDLPPSLEGLQYSSYICGVITGALEQMQLKVQCTVVKDVLTGADTTDFKIHLIELLKDVFVDLEDV